VKAGHNLKANPGAIEAVVDRQEVHNEEISMNTIGRF
jgi:hypothetical protein